MRKNTTTTPSGVHPVSLTIQVSPAEVDAGADLTVTVKAVSSPDGTSIGNFVAITDSAGAELARVTLEPTSAEVEEEDDDGDAEFDAADEDDLDSDDEPSAALTGVVVVRAPSATGNHVLRAVLHGPGEHEAGVGAITAEVSFVVIAHAATINVWDISPAVPAGERASLTIGVKCSCGCNLADRSYRVLDQDGRQVADGVLRTEVWPKTTALYYDQAQAAVPAALGLHTWTVETPEWSGNGLPHAAASTPFTVKVVAAPDFEITVETIDAEKQTPVKGMHVLLYPYRAVTDDRGLARIKVARGRYELHISGFKYAAYHDMIDADDDLVLHAELFVSPDDEPYLPPVEPPPTRFTVLRKAQA